MLTDHDLDRLRNTANRSSSDTVELHPLELQRLICEIYALRSEIALNDHRFASARMLEIASR